MEQRSQRLSIAVAAVLLAASSATPAEETAAPDTSAWACSKCQFAQGYRGDAEIGAGWLDDSSAKFGDYTGLDEDGVYVVADAEGGVTLESGYRLDYELLDLGLDSRAALIEGGKQGQYDFSLFYDRIPHRISDTGETIFSGIGSDDLSLPDGWVTAGSTSGMTALDSSLRGVDVGYDRDRYGASGRYFLGDKWTFGLDYKRDERSGTRPRYGSFGSVSSEMLRPIDDTTDRISADVRYQGKHWFAQLGYYASIYDTKAAGFRFDNPFNAFVAGGEQGRMALEPDNLYSEFAASFGWYGLPWNTAVTLSAAMGEGSQDTGFYPYTINPNIALDPLPFSDLDGDVSVTRADLTVSSRPLQRLRLRGFASYDERDNDSRQGTFTSIVHTDLFPVVEDRVNAVYGYERMRLNGSADFEVYDDLAVGVGGEWRTLDRTGSTVEVSSEEVLDGWGSVQFRPSGYLGIVAKGGVEERDPDRYDVNVAIESGQNPLMRKYNMAYRYRSYGELVANVAIGTLPVSLGGNVFYGDDSYLQSELGMVSGLDRRYGVDLNWTVNEKITAYATLGREKIDARTRGSSTFTTADWTGEVQDDFETYGAGMNARFTDRILVELDYSYAAGDSNTQIRGAGAGSFPTVKSELSSFKAGMTYGFSERTELMLTWWYETLSTSDWSYASNPAAMPTVLGLGVDPYNYDVNYVTLSMRYRFGGSQATATAEVKAEE
jgi:MtrB/PioB family decaheme-associated outer membrane protein